MATIDNNVYNHHVQLFDVGKSADQTVKCGKMEASDVKSGFKIPGAYIGGNASDGAPSLFTTPDGTFNSGYYLGEKSKTIMSAELVNYGREAKDVYRHRGRNHDDQPMRLNSESVPEGSRGPEKMGDEEQRSYHYTRRIPGL